MFQFNFQDDEGGADEGGVSGGGGQVTVVDTSLPWQRKALTEEEQAEEQRDSFRALSWAEKWQRCSDPVLPLGLSTSSADATVQYVWHFDMINDTPRNKAYSDAIGKTLREICAEDQASGDLQVLDVGTGSGLLALLAAKHGASCVTAVEVEAAVARVASINVNKNGADSVVTVHNGHSMSPSIQVPSPVQLVVTELLDTGLLGEAFIPVLRDAKARGWMADGCRVIPARGRVFGQLVQSTYMHHLAVLDPSRKGFGFTLPEKDDNVKANEMISPFDCSFRHLLQSGEAETLSAPFVAWDFDFEDLPAESGRSKVLQVPVTGTGVVHAVLFWWEVGLDREWEFKLSSEASCSNSGGRHQDHWVQAFTVLNPPFECTKDQIVNLNAFHNDENIWFEVVNEERNSNLLNDVLFSQEAKTKKPLKKNTEVADLYDSERVMQMNSHRRNETISCHIEKVLQRRFLPQIDKRPYCVAVLGDGPLLPLLINDCFNKCLKTSHKEFSNSNNIYKIISLEGSEECQALSMKFLFSNDCFPPAVTSSTCDPDWALKSNSVNLLCGEPFFQPDAFCKTWGKSSLIRYWMACHALTPFLAPDAELLPARAVVRVMAVECENLWRARLPCPISVESLDLTALNTLHSFNKTDSVPLWRYDHKILSSAVKVLDMNFWTDPCNANVKKQSFDVDITESGVCHGLVMWIEYSSLARARDCDADEKRSLNETESVWCSSAPSMSGATTPHLQGIRFCMKEQPVEKGSHIACTATLDVLGNDIAISITE